MGSRAAIFIQRGAPQTKQQRLCLDYIEEEHWQLVGMVPPSGARDAAALVSAGVVDVIITAFDSPAAQALATLVGPCGMVMFVHPLPTCIKVKSILPTLAELIVRWFRHGRTVRQIADEVGSDTSDVREVLRRGGEQPDRSD
jgi:hypothetical protein